MTEIDDIVGDFELFADWDERYQYLIELGEHLAPMPDAMKTEDNRVKACMSKVWVSGFPDSRNPALIRYHGDCDTSIIKGVVALLVDLFSGRSAEAIAKLDVDTLFERIQLAEHLSPNRHVGVYAIERLMKQQAGALNTSASG
ncbi:MAG: SufE family protein [Thiotrichales bacterium]